MNEVVCHKCEELKPRDKCSLARVWVGVIDAEKAERLVCFTCLAAMRAEIEENSRWEDEGEGWKGNYNRDDDNGEEWKNAQ